MLAAASQAASQDVKSQPELLVYCPALVAGSGCPEAVAAFVEYTDPTGDKIYDSFCDFRRREPADRAHEVCLDAADGLHVFPRSLFAAEKKQEIAEIANGPPQWFFYQTPARRSPAGRGLGGQVGPNGLRRSIG